MNLSSETLRVLHASGMIPATKERNSKKSIMKLLSTENFDLREGVRALLEFQLSFSNRVQVMMDKILKLESWIQNLDSALVDFENRLCAVEESIVKCSPPSVEMMRSEINSLKLVNGSFQSRTDALEDKSRENNIVISGVSEHDKESRSCTVDKVLPLCSETLGVAGITIVNAYRLVIGADILDVTNQNTKTFGKLEEEPTYFELSPRQKSHWDTMQKINSYIREEYHSIQELMWKHGYTNMLSSLPSSDSIPVGEPDACRLRGSLTVNKVSGNFHIIAGKHIPHPAGHAHLSAFLGDSDFNFSHRIEKFSFGDPVAGVFGPLEGDEKIASTNYHLYQYYLKVVPTELSRPPVSQVAFQYSVTEQERPINHQAGSHGVPGIYFKYDMSFVKVKVSLEKHSLWRFLVRLCGIIGGVFATSGILNGFVKFVVELVACRFVQNAARRSGKGHDLTSSLEPTEVPEAPKIASLCVVPENQLTKDINSFAL